MWDTLRNAWKVPEVRKKLLYTFMMLLVYRLVSMIPAPGINASVVAEVSQQFDVLNLVNMMTGNAFQQMTVMAMGITPYINASIIMQLLTIAIPALERLAKEGGEEGKQKINKITRYATIGFAVLQSIGIIAGLQSASMGAGQTNVLKPEYNSLFGMLTIGMTMAGGTALAMWIGERVTANGIGNGISLLIFAGIISNLFNGILTAFLDILGIQTGATTVVQFVILILFTIGIIVAVTFVDLGERRIPVQYAKRVVGRKMYGGQSTHIPIKVMSVGVLPLIFAYSFMAFPGTIIAMFGTNSGAYQWWQTYMGQTSPLYLGVTALLIVAFTYFYQSISFNPQDISKNINQQGGTIPGIRSGKNTTDFLARTSKRLTLFAAIVLALLATVPSLLYVWQSVQIPYAASSILIAVSVSMETMRQLEAQMVMRNYKGFL
ncbi:MAG: preprotein translocase subunit SecY [Eubacteriales bacterium]|jgi:preprotein translocase subunit SecY|nr:preprotein translocase subunit SecY [Eubacteriales bacterium]MDD4105423.1 preprotein translocase subunit SecY [Eubacteriales bacterium]MDD4710155.1 preprotein translocase subunit SecY [Eubacteriales bacterium]NLO15778.1 preprotein translocase subunit SecY [Clostridiales bacterium]